MDLHVSGVRSDQLRDDSDFPAHYPLKSTTLKVKIEENSGGMSHAIHKTNVSVSVTEEQEESVKTGSDRSSRRSRGNPKNF